MSNFAALPALKPANEVALAHHWLVTYRGGEKVLEEFRRLFPQAPLATLVAKRGEVPDWVFGPQVLSSWLQLIPGAARYYKQLLPLHPSAFGRLAVPESTRFVLSSDAAMVKGLSIPAQAKHVCYCHSPPRYLWDMHHTPLAVAGGRGGGANYSSAAVVHNTPPTITSIWAAPGRYTVKLTANGQSYTQPLTLKLDPRVRTPAIGLQQQSSLSRQLYDEVLAVQKVLSQVRALRGQIRDIKAEGAAAQALTEFDKQVAAIEGGGGGRGGRGGGGGRGAIEAGPETLSSATASLTALLRQLEAADAAPTTQLTAAIAGRRAPMAQLMAKWTALKTTGMFSVNARLKQAGLTELSVK